MRTNATLPIIVLVTVNEHETTALLDAFIGKETPPEQAVRGEVTYNLLGQHGDNEIVHTVSEMGAGGLGASQQRAAEAIEHWKPTAIIAVGVAFGVDESNQKIGDVLVSTQIINYDLGKVESDGTITPRGDKPGCSAGLLNRIRQTDLVHRRSGVKWPVVRFGPVLSGQKLVDNLDYRESLKGLATEALGGEMEATGVYVSAVTKKTDWIVVKAICDWGYNKNNAKKQLWQKTAARQAAHVIKSVLSGAGRNKESRTIRGSGNNREDSFAAKRIARISEGTLDISQTLCIELDHLHVGEDIRRAVAQVVTHSQYPTVMSFGTSMVRNPVWDFVKNDELRRIRRLYQPTGSTIPKILRLDMLLIRRDDQRHDGELLTYYSPGWQTYLIHFRPLKPEDDPSERPRANAVKFAVKWGVPPESISVNSTGKFAVSAKINAEYKDLYLYIFEFFSVRCSQWSEELRQIYRDGYTGGTPVDRRGKWLDLRKMRNDPAMIKVNGDAVRAVHHFFDVNLGALPYSFPD